MTPDPNINEALEEMTEILKRRNLMGIVSVVSDDKGEHGSHAAFTSHFGTSWSAAWIEEFPDGRAGLRLRCKQADYPTKEAWENTMNATINGMIGLVQTSMPLYGMIKNMVSEVSNRMEIITASGTVTGVEVRGVRE